jgi:hypothetical protein
MIKNDSRRIATHLQLTEWLYYAIFSREVWIFLPDLRCSTLGTAESFTITQLSRSLQGLPGGYYRIHCRVEGSAVSMHLKAPHRTYLSKLQTWKKEAGYTRGEGTQLSPNSPQLFTTIGVSSHHFFPGLIAWKKCIEIALFYRWTKVTWM